MAFVNEIIPEEEKEKFTFDVFTRPDGSKPTLWKWTIDRERDARLVISNIIGGGYDGTEPVQYFVMIWRGQLITFCGQYKVGGSWEEGYLLTWQVTNLKTPESIEHRKAEAMELIKEALDLKGQDYVKKNLKSVAVNF